MYHQTAVKRLHLEIRNTGRSTSVDPATLGRTPDSEPSPIP
jgi:hypothetical protein